jgi:phospholipid/cholesterol/gamma-HCH transport system permease protein
VGRGVPHQAERALTALTAITNGFRRVLEVVQDVTLFCVQVLRSAFFPPFYKHEILEQIHFSLVGSLFIVMFSSLVAGQALAIQLARELAKTGTKSELGHFMVISSVRALGPVLVGIVVASRMAAGITAELGTMRSSDQIDALVAFGTDPMKRLVAPRMIGLWIALPVLTILGDALSVIGGGFIGLGYHITLESYYSGVAKYLTPSNLLVGMIKPIFFAVLITTVACWKGLTSEGGAKGVGVATTESVVICSVGILVTDFICTKLIFRILGW